MEYQDKKLICRDCHKTFIWSAGEQRFFAKKGFTNIPTRCPSCREKFKKRKQEGTLEAQITCSVCGKYDKVLVTPRYPEKAMCKECFEDFIKQQKPPTSIK